MGVNIKAGGTSTWGNNCFFVHVCVFYNVHRWGIGYKGWTTNDYLTDQSDFTLLFYRVLFARLFLAQPVRVRAALIVNISLKSNFLCQKLKTTQVQKSRMISSPSRSFRPLACSKRQLQRKRFHRSSYFAFTALFCLLRIGRLARVTQLLYSLKNNLHQAEVTIFTARTINAFEAFEFLCP